MERTEAQNRGKERGICSPSVYFIQAGDYGPIKIGTTNGDPLVRMADLQTSHYQALKLLGTVPGDIEVEKEWHTRFAQYWLRGEWFKPSRELLAVIGYVVTAPTVAMRRARETPGRLGFEPEDAVEVVRAKALAYLASQEPGRPSGDAP